MPKAYEQQGEGAVYGTVNAAEFTRIECPVCGRVITVFRGQFDVTHDCTIQCPHCDQTMNPIPPDPSQALIPLVVKRATELIMDGWKEYFYYCANAVCPYYLESGTAYMQKQVQVDIFANA
jgi:ribosomal protein S27E